MGPHRGMPNVPQALGVSSPVEVLLFLGGFGLVLLFLLVSNRSIYKPSDVRPAVPKPAKPKPKPKKGYILRAAAKRRTRVPQARKDV